MFISLGYIPPVFSYGLFLTDHVHKIAQVANFVPVVRKKQAV